MGEVTPFPERPINIYLVSCPECEGVKFEVMTKRDEWEEPEDLIGLICAHCTFFMVLQKEEPKE